MKWFKYFVLKYIEKSITFLSPIYLYKRNKTDLIISTGIHHPAYNVYSLKVCGNSYNQSQSIYL
jgi:hypothetical protein